ncbi:MAG: hypothetical protein JSS30_00585 [Verrucomicrobia bacterium]|nr:hypothetical protein [Verrucomicrobiota bacterium]
MLFLGCHLAKTAVVRKEKNSMRIEYLGEDVNPLYNGAEIVTGLDTRDVMLRNLPLRLKSKREIWAALPFQVEHLFPYSPEEIILLPTLYPKEQETEVFLLASSQGALQRHLADMASLGIDPDVVSCVPLALYRFATHFFPNHSSFFVYHCEEDEHTFIVIKEGRLYASQVNRTDDLDRMCAYMQKKFPEIQAILHTGIDNLPTPFIPIEFDDLSMAEYAIPIGLALDAAKGGGQFRQSTLSKKEIKNRKTRLFTFLAACGAFIFSTLLLGHFHLQKKENAALAALGIPKGAHLEEVVMQLYSSIQSPKKSHLRVTTIPKVHEVLTWLSTHPDLAVESSITQLRYDLVTAPKLGSDVKSYAATVDLELSLPSAKVARQFHEALLKDQEMIDQKNPIQWSGDHGIYRTKFYLKPRAIK